MLAIELHKWKHSVDTLFVHAAAEPHPRTRERILILVKLLQSGLSLFDYCNRYGLRYMTCRAWVLNYNERGLEGLKYVRSGGRRPLFRLSRPTN